MSSSDLLSSYATDQSMCRVYPADVFIPKSRAELASFVREHARTFDGSPKRSLTVRAGGTCMSGGPLGEGVIIDITNLGAILEDSTDTLRVLGGTWHKDVESHLTPRGRMFAPYTSSKDICSIGGMIGNNASGEKSIRYGATRDNVESLTLLASDGNEYILGPLSHEEALRKCEQRDFEGSLYRSVMRLYAEHRETLAESFPHTKKNASGYALDKVHDPSTNVWNLAKLIVGSQGTLGIVTEAVLTTVPLFSCKKLFVIPIVRFEDVPALLSKLRETEPESIELYDKTTLCGAIKEDSEKESSLGHLRENIATMLVEYAGESSEALSRMEQSFLLCMQSLQARHETVEDARIAELHWNTRRRSYTLFKKYAERGVPVPIVEDVSVPLDSLAAFFHGLEALIRARQIECVFHGHIGDGGIRIFPLIDFSKKDAKERLVGFSRDVFALVKTHNGTISTDHGDGIVRTPFLYMQYDQRLLDAFKEIKCAFDPHGMFNPGKKVGGSLEYFLEHIKF